MRIEYLFIGQKNFSLAKFSAISGKHSALDYMELLYTGLFKSPVTVHMNLVKMIGVIINFDVTKLILNCFRLCFH